MKEDMYDTCRWCKHFKATESVCTNDHAFDGLSGEIPVYHFYEDGTLSEAIKEGFKENSFLKLGTELFDSKLSKKAQKEILDVFKEELDEAIADWTESIDTQVSRALNNYDFQCDDGGVVIADPHSFSCRFFG